MSVKDKKVIFRTTEAFYEEHIRRPRLTLGYEYDSSFLRDVLLRERAETGKIIPLPSRRILESLYSELELSRVNFEEAELRCHALENAPDGRVFRKLSDNADRILRDILKSLNHKKTPSKR
jgi:hypothetical protein